MGMADDKIWETVNPGLDQFLRFERSSDNIGSVICCGEGGVKSFVQYLKYLVEEKGVKDGLLEGKVTVLLDTINNL